MNLKSNEVQRFYSDITIGKREIGRITFELFADKTPKAAENFGSFASVISANDTLEKLLSGRQKHFILSTGKYLVPANTLFCED